MPLQTQRLVALVAILAELEAYSGVKERLKSGSGLG